MALSRRHAGSRPDSHFAATRWTVVCAARSQEAATVDRALEELCSVYWYPLYTFVRRSGHPREKAEELIREFFATLLSKGFLTEVEPEKGRFRSFLLSAMKRFMAKESKSGGPENEERREMPIAFDIAWAEECYGNEPADATTPELLYDRSWAVRLADRVMGALEHEYAGKGLDAIFHALKGELGRRPGSTPFAEIAPQLGMREGAVKTAMSRLRGRYAERLNDEIAQTVSAAEDVDDEIAYLFHTHR